MLRNNFSIRLRFQVDFILGFPSLVESQEIKDLTVFEGYGLQWLNLIEHILSQSQVFAAHRLHSLIIIIHLKDGAFLQP